MPTAPSAMTSASTKAENRRVDMTGSFSVFPEFRVANNRPMIRSIVFMVLLPLLASRVPGSSPTVGSAMGGRLSPRGGRQGAVEQCSPRCHRAVSPPFLDVSCTVFAAHDTD